MNIQIFKYKKINTFNSEILELQIKQNIIKKLTYIL